MGIWNQSEQGELIHEIHASSFLPNFSTGLKQVNITDKVSLFDSLPKVILACAHKSPSNAQYLGRQKKFSREFNKGVGKVRRV